MSVEWLSKGQVGADERKKWHPTRQNSSRTQVNIAKSCITGIAVFDKVGRGYSTIEYATKSQRMTPIREHTAPVP